MSVSCFHCGLPALNSSIQMQVNQQRETFCCTGCMAAATAIIDGGLDNFYTIRDAYNEQANNDLNRDDYSYYDHPDIQKQFAYVTDSSGLLEFRLQIQGITCAACVWLIEQSLNQIPGIKTAILNLSAHRLLIRLDSEKIAISQVFKQIRKLGYSAKPWRVNSKQDTFEQHQKDFLVRIGVAGIGMMQVGMNTFAMYLGDIDDQYFQLLRWASLILTLPVFIYSAFPFYRSALRDIRSRHFGMDTPVSIALVLAFIPSVWATFTGRGDTYFESVVMFTFFLLLGRYLEFRVRMHLDSSDYGLDDLLPVMAHKIENNCVTDVPVSELQTGDNIEIKSGEKIPADGIVKHGNSEVSLAFVTGEFTPEPVFPGKKVLAGAVNTDGILTVTVSETASNTALSKMIGLLELAAAHKPKIAQLADQGASSFVLLVLGLSLLTGVTWLWLSPQDAFWVALSVLVVTCPCALSLATPVALTTGALAFRQIGILPVKGEAMLELSKIDTAIFDKTGTLTLGDYQIEQWENFSTKPDAEILRIAADLESHSEHPIAFAFKQYYSDSRSSDIKVSVGQGIMAIIDNTAYRIGRPEFCQDHDAPVQGHWISLSTSNPDKTLARFKIDDTLRADSQKCITSLRKAGIHCVLLTGDSSSVAHAIGEQLEFESVYVNQSPEDKLNIVTQLQQAGHRVLMIGDGFNDVLPMAAADISCAMDNSTELTRQQADLVALKNRLAIIYPAIELSQKIRKIIKQNIAWGLIYNAVALPFAMAGYVTPWMAAIGMSLSSLIVVLNATRIKHRGTV